MQENTIYDVGLYLRLSQEDDQRGESVSIGTQRVILTDYCQKQGYRKSEHHAFALLTKSDSICSGINCIANAVGTR